MNRDIIFDQAHSAVSRDFQKAKEEAKKGTRNTIATGNIWVPHGIGGSSLHGRNNYHPGCI